MVIAPEQLPHMSADELRQLVSSLLQTVAAREGEITFKQATIDKLNATVNAIFKDPAFRTKWEAIGTPVVAGNAADFGALIKADAQRLGKLVRDAGVTVD